VNAFPLCYNCLDATLTQARVLGPPNVTRASREEYLSRQWISGPLDGVMTLHLPTGSRPISTLIEHLEDFKATHVGRSSAVNCTACQKPIARGRRLSTNPNSVSHLALRCTVCSNLCHRHCCCESVELRQGSFPRFVCPSCATLFIRQQVENSMVLNSF
jgi:hypothetical protein